MWIRSGWLALTPSSSIAMMVDRRPVLIAHASIALTSAWEVWRFSACICQVHVSRFAGERFRTEPVKRV